MRKNLSPDIGRVSHVTKGEFNIVNRNCKLSCNALVIIIQVTNRSFTDGI